MVYGSNYMRCITKIVNYEKVNLDINRLKTADNSQTEGTK